MQRGSISNNNNSNSINNINNSSSNKIKPPAPKNALLGTEYYTRESRPPYFILDEHDLLLQYGTTTTSTLGNKDIQRKESIDKFGFTIVEGDTNDDTHSNSNSALGIRHSLKRMLSKTSLVVGYDTNNNNDTTSYNRMVNNPAVDNNNEQNSSKDAIIHTESTTTNSNHNNNTPLNHTFHSNNHTLLPNHQTLITPTWRLKERMKTVGVGLILALNIGTDPPDVNKPNPCARLQCWFDPSSTSRAKAREGIGERLEIQYSRWQQRAKIKYKRALDPTVEAVRNLCYGLRRMARGERLLLHYNGHGVPRPTENGEIWVFDKNHTQYIPLAVGDLKKWIGKPSLVVLDCSCAGRLIPFLINNSHNNGTTHDNNNYDNVTFNSSPNSTNNNNNPSNSINMHTNTTTSPTKTTTTTTQHTTTTTTTPGYPSSNLHSPHNTEDLDHDSSTSAQSVSDIIVLCPTSASDTLPLNPELPADLFTSCLTTPIQVALRHFIHQNQLSCSSIDAESVDFILQKTGKLTDRKTPLGELNWIFTAITDTIAFNVLPSSLFQRLFRQDLLVASMFRNFLLADRIFRRLHCTPLSYPALPSTCDHPLWEAWDLAVETCLCQLMKEGILGVTRRTPAGVRSNSKENFEDEDEESQDGNSDDRGDVSKSDKRADSSGGGNQNLSDQDERNYSGKGINNNNQISNEGNSTTTSYNITSPFFAEQLTAFEIWLDYASRSIKEGGVILSPPRKKFDSSFFLNEYPSRSLDIESPEYLPVVLQVLLSPAHRVRALILLRRFLYLGPSAVNLALSVGIFPYVVRLLQSPIDEYKHILVGIWGKILEFDPSCQVDLVRDGALPHFIRHLHWGLETNQIGDKNMNNIKSLSGGPDDVVHQRTMAAVILSAICFDYPSGQYECIKSNAHGACSSLLKIVESIPNVSIEEATRISENIPSSFRLWICIFLGVLMKNNISAQEEGFKSLIQIRLFERLRDDSSEVRAGACFALGCLLGSSKGEASANRKVVTSNQNMTHSPSITTQSNVPNSSSSQGLNGTKSSTVPNIKPTGSLPWQQHQLISMQTLIQPQSDLGSISSGSAVNSRLLPTGNRSYAPLVPPTAPTFQPQQNQYHHETQQLHQQQNNMYSRENIYHEGRNQTSDLQDPTRVKNDMTIIKEIVNICDDISSNVRYEATLVLGCVVKKYLTDFMAIADQINKTHLDASNQGTVASVGSNLKPDSLGKLTSIERSSNNNAEMILRDAWEKLRYLHHNDPHPHVSSAATTIVRFVNEHVLIMKLQSKTQRSVINGANKNDAESESSLLRQGRSISSLNLGTNSPQPTEKNLNTDPFLNGLGLRRNQTELRIEGKWEDTHPTPDTGSVNMNNMEQTLQLDYSLPESSFYEWKKKAFVGTSVDLLNQKEEIFFNDQFTTQIDPLSIEGATQIYREGRNAKVFAEGNTLSERMSALRPREQPVEPSLFSLEDEVDEEMENLITNLKNSLHLNQTGLMINHGKKMTYMLRFHSYEPALVACESSDSISVWDFEKSTKVNSFTNGNPGNSIMTSLLWINEKNNSLLLTGCDDGSVRLWDNLIEDNGRLSTEKPTLVTAFYASSDIIPGKKGSGLVAEWQQSHGRLVAGGCSKWLRCLDFNSEKVTNSIDSNTESCITALRTAWDYDSLEDVSHNPNTEGYSGFGPDIILAGYGDGALKVFDIRCHEGVKRVGNNNRLVRKRQIESSEHTDWIVNISFTQGAGSRYEVVSGSIAGDIIFWDLRMTNIIQKRTVDIQRRGMTALSCHPRIPLLAAGSHAQFIKLFTPDGDILQVIRYHEKMPSRRIGAVSCLSFHPNKPILAAGATDEIISMYKTKT